MEIFQAISVLLIYLFLYYIFGDIAVRLLKIKFHNATIKLLLEYFFILEKGRPGIQYVQPGKRYAHALRMHA